MIDIGNSYDVRHQIRRADGEYRWFLSRGEPSRDKDGRTKGMGMGLSISRAIIEAHGGQQWLAPNTPHGAAFCFSLPIEALAA